MNGPDQLRKIAESILEAPNSEDAASKAGELLKLAAEIENQAAGAKKLELEERNLELDLTESRDKRRSEDRKALITLLAPVFTTVVLVGTLVFQVIQFRQSEKDKATEVAHQAEIQEDLQWTQALETLSKMEKVSPASALLKKFSNSPRYKDEAHRTAVQILIKTNDQVAFEDIFNFVYDPVNWEKLPQILALNRTVGSGYMSLVQNAWDYKTSEPVKSKLLPDERIEVAADEHKLRFITARLESLLKSKRPSGETLDLRGVYLWDGHFQGADLTEANLNDAGLTSLNLKGADLSGVTEFQRAQFQGTAWWRADRVSDALLKYLHCNYPFQPGTVYEEDSSGKPDSLISANGYDADFKRLSKLAAISLDCTK